MNGEKKALWGFVEVRTIESVYEATTPRPSTIPDEVVRHLEITESTWHRWGNQYGGMKADDANESRELRKENQRLKKPLADRPSTTRCSRRSAAETSDPGLPPAGRERPSESSSG